MKNELISPTFHWGYFVAPHHGKVKLKSVTRTFPTKISFVHRCLLSWVFVYLWCSVFVDVCLEKLLGPVWMELKRLKLKKQRRRSINGISLSPNQYQAIGLVNQILWKWGSPRLYPPPITSLIIFCLKPFYHEYLWIQFQEGKWALMVFFVWSAFLWGGHWEWFKTIVEKEGNWVWEEMEFHGNAWKGKEKLLSILVWK